MSPYQGSAGLLPAGYVFLKRSSLHPTAFELSPDRGIVIFTVAFIEGCKVGDGALVGTAGRGVVGDGALDGLAGMEVFDLVPLGAGETDAGEPFAAGEDDAAVLVVPGVVFVLAQHRELDAVDGAEFFQGQPQGHGRQHVDLHQRLPPLIVGAQGAGALPLWGEVDESAVVQPGVVLGPAFFGEGVVPAFLPEFGVVGGETV